MRSASWEESHRKRQKIDGDTLVALLGEGEGTDEEVPRSYRISSVVLASNSDVLRTALRGLGNVHSTLPVEIVLFAEEERRSFDDLLRFLYGRLHAYPLESMPPERLARFAVMADRFLVNAAIAQVADQLRQQLLAAKRNWRGGASDIVNVVMSLPDSLLGRDECKALLDLVHTVLVLANTAHTSLMMRDLNVGACRMLLASDDITRPEVDLYRALVHWSTHKGTVEQASKLVGLLRFAHMPESYVRDVVLPSTLPFLPASLVEREQLVARACTPRAVAEQTGDFSVSMHVPLPTVGKAVHTAHVRFVFGGVAWVATVFIAHDQANGTLTCGAQLEGDWAELGLVQPSPAFAFDCSTMLIRQHPVVLHTQANVTQHDLASPAIIMSDMLLTPDHLAGNTDALRIRVNFHAQ
jgi:hypothetical protein